MKYALKFTESEEIETTLWVWFHDHGAYCMNDRDGIVMEAESGFIDTNLKPETSGDVERVPFSDVPDHVKGHDPRDILHKLPREYDDE